jgi:hypothetical protein
MSNAHHRRRRHDLRSPWAQATTGGVYRPRSSVPTRQVASTRRRSDSTSASIFAAVWATAMGSVKVSATAVKWMWRVYPDPTIA